VTLVALAVWHRGTRWTRRRRTAVIGLQPLVTDEELAAATAAAYGHTDVDEQHRQIIRAAQQAYGPRLIARLPTDDQPSADS
jgi:hypothetical protein